MASASDENFLLHLSKELSVEDLEGLKYVSLDFIPRRETEDVASGFKLHDLLEQDGRITRENLSLLEEMLEAIKRADLAWKVQQFASVDANTAANVGMSIESRIFPARDLVHTLTINCMKIHNGMRKLRPSEIIYSFKAD